MRVLSATEAFTPAFERTRSIFFQPFHPGRSWKLGFVAYLSMMGAMFLPTPLAVVFNPALMHGAKTPALMGMTLLSVLFVLILFVFFYLGNRLLFVLFDIIVVREQFVAPAWHRHGQKTWRWIGLKLALSLAFIVIAGAPLYISFHRLMAVSAVTPGRPPSPQFFATFFSAYLMMLSCIAAVMFASSLLNDFVLAPVALENATLGNALRRFGALCMAEPLAVLGYAGMKILIGICSFIAMEVCVLLAELVVVIVALIIGGLGWLVFHSFGTTAKLMAGIGAVILVLVFIAVMIYASFLVLGMGVTFLQAYGLYFLGGRYPLLGDLLEPPPAPYPPPPPLPELLPQ